MFKVGQTDKWIWENIERPVWVWLLKRQGERYPKTVKELEETQ